MKKSGLLLILPLMIIFLMSFVVAQYVGPAGLMDQQLNLNDFLSAIFGVQNTTWGQFIIIFVVFIMLFVAFGDIIHTFTQFSKGVSWILAFCIAFIGLVTRTVLGFAMGLAAITAWAGTFAVFLVIIMAFVVVVLVNFGVKGIGEWLLRRKAYMEATRKGIKITAGAKILTEVSEHTK